MNVSIVFAACLTVACGVSLFGAYPAAAKDSAPQSESVAADNKNIQYMGRIDFSDPKKPRFWAAGCTVRAKFRGTYCDAIVNDQVLWGNSHNYIEIVVDDGKPIRVQTTGPVNTIRVAEGLPEGTHTVTLCKDTESGIGYLDFLGFRCAGLVRPDRQPRRKMEFIGDSITCGTGSDTSVKPCGEGQWYDQHNAYMSYGPAAARALDAQWHLTSSSGIGVHHSCCDMKVTMPDVFGRMDLSANAPGEWDFARYQPDVVTICLGQNDGAGDPEAFHAAYIAFIHQIRGRYPRAQIVCLTSPMADAALTSFMKDSLTTIVEQMQQAGDKKIHAYFFSRSYNDGCGGHPSMAQHQLIAAELAAYCKATFGW
ncbi:acetylxylan esterase [Capsulimonas corticalis]|uniref:Acetylxylan esterase n=1 Tax=Capsulimonas corticalis TaxID=2219043 RepID=A0A9N7L4R2_9BACT|nr:SGNH/GDSL hydrolase family protein [Capsulimonas corticalis]BDI31621.1 acetylxylan esterase [Capsulimonas corticalis]